MFFCFFCLLLCDCYCHLPTTQIWALLNSRKYDVKIKNKYSIKLMQSLLFSKISFWGIWSSDYCLWIKIALSFQRSMCSIVNYFKAKSQRFPNLNMSHWLRMTLITHNIDKSILYIVRPQYNPIETEIPLYSQNTWHIFQSAALTVLLFIVVFNPSIWLQKSIWHYTAVNANQFV